MKYHPYEKNKGGSVGTGGRCLLSSQGKGSILLHGSGTDVPYGCSVQQHDIMHHFLMNDSQSPLSPKLYLSNVQLKCD